MQGWAESDVERVSPWELEPEQADAAPRGDEARRAEEAASRAARASALAARRCAQTFCVLPRQDLRTLCLLLSAPVPATTVTWQPSHAMGAAAAAPLRSMPAGP